MGQVSVARNPCIIIQPGFFLINKCNSDSIQSPLIPPSSPLNGNLVPFLPPKLIMFLIGLTTLSCRAFMLNSFLCQMCIGIIKPYCLHSYLLLITQKSVQFLNGLVLYKQFQLMIHFFNIVYKRSVACMLFFIVVEATLSMYACVSLGAFLPTERRIIFGYTACNMFFCVTIVYGTLAAIHENSVQFLELFKNLHVSQLRKHVYRKFFRSYAPVRIALGDGFVETSTPLECQHLIIEQTVNLTLLQ